MFEKIAEDEIVEIICKNLQINPEKYEDFVQEIYLILLEYDEDKIKFMYDNGQLNFFITKVIKNQWFSKTSPYYKKYRKFWDMIDDNKSGINCYIDEPTEID